MFCFAIFTFILVVGNLVKLADLVINKGVNLLSVGKLFALLLPSLLNYTIPMAVLVGILLTFGYLSANNEITAIRCSGFALSRILIPLITIGIIISLSLVVLENYIIPWSHFASRKTLIEIGSREPASCLESGRFIKEFKDYIIFIHEIKGNKLKHIRIYQPRYAKNTRTIVAQRGVLIPFSSDKEEKIALKLIDGWSEEQNPQEPDKFYKAKFKDYKLTLNPTSRLKKETVEKKIKDMNIKELKKEIGRLKKKGISAIPLIAEMQRKFSFSFSVLAFIIVGFPLGIIAKRGEKPIGFGLGLAIILLYYLLMAGSKGLIISKGANPYFWMWLPNVIIAGIGVVLTYLMVER